MSFKVFTKSDESLARLGKLETGHGDLQTPFFMPIATQGAIKGITSAELVSIGAQIALSNTYHLWLRPGEDIIAKAGGLHKFMRWNKPILTDSGGYQVFSLAKMRKLQSDGVEFQSHLNGEKRFLTPEKAIAIQHKLGSDIMMVLDECAPFPCTREQAEKAVTRTTNWGRISKLKIKSSKEAQNPKSKTFGIVQGSVYKDLRLKSARELVGLDFDGYAIGGLAVGEPEKNMYEVLDYTVPELPEAKPRYLMGVGYPHQIVEAVKRGIDMFDCVLPTRNARHGSLFIGGSEKQLWEGESYAVLRIKNDKYKADFEVLDKNCDCPTCQAGYTRAYLRHLLVAKEPLYIRLATLHNLRFYLKLMAKIREQIKSGQL
ncbi:tRNA guanosine(34) transglycosylase Tgt [Patescibacteria group bacterium]